MEIKTKFNIDDKVWAMHENVPREFHVAKINISVNKAWRDINYHLFLDSKEYSVLENKLFASKAELLASL